MSAESEPLESAGPSPEAEALSSLWQLRDALRHRDARTVVALRSSRPRAPGDRDLLADLCDAEGIERATRRVAPFWQKARVALEAVREVSPEEVEVYERIALDREQLQVVTLVRYEAGRWRVVSTRESRDERLRVWVTSRHDALDEGRWTRTFAEQHGPHAEMLLQDRGGVIGRPDWGWVADVTGPFVPGAWPDAMPGEGMALVQLDLTLSADPHEREEQRQWILQIADVLLDEQEGISAYLPDLGKLVPADAVHWAAHSVLSPSQRTQLWCGLELVGGYWRTSGMRLLGRPEIEIARGTLGGDAAERQVLRWLATRIEQSGTMPERDSWIELGDLALRCTAGRRGPRLGRSYGRWGSIQLTEPTRMRHSSGIRVSPS